MATPKCKNPDCRCTSCQVAREEAEIQKKSQHEPQQTAAVLSLRLVQERHSFKNPPKESLDAENAVVAEGLGQLPLNPAKTNPSTTNRPPQELSLPIQCPPAKFKVWHDGPRNNATEAQLEQQRQPVLRIQLARESIPGQEVATKQAAWRGEDERIFHISL